MTAALLQARHTESFCVQISQGIFKAINNQLISIGKQLSSTPSQEQKKLDARRKNKYDETITKQNGEHSM